MNDYPDKRRLQNLARLLKRYFEQTDAPVKHFMDLQRNDPYRVLVCTVLSARTRDQVTLKVAGTLLHAAPTPAALRALPLPTVETLVRSCGFYRDKAAHLKALAQRLGDTYDDRIPDQLPDLLSLPGVGRKTANLVLTLGYAQAAISVDIHVFRISHRIGLVDTPSPEKTEAALRDMLPLRLWRDWNPWLVALGQTCCMPRHPQCGRCPIAGLCDQRGV